MKVTMRKGGNKMTNFHINGHYHIVEMLPFIFHHKEIIYHIAMILYEINLVLLCFLLGNMAIMFFLFIFDYM